MRIGFAGVVDGPEEYAAVEIAMKSGWHGSGPQAEAFEKEFADYLGVEHCLLVNSGSSANLLALKVLDLKPGTRVMTSGCGFPATLNPIIHCGLEPVLIDYDLKTQNIDLDAIERKIEAIQLEYGCAPVKAMIVAHTLGIPINLDRLEKICEDNGIYLIEDCCEALVSKHDGRNVGTVGDIGTFSFYPSHQMNGLGGGGCIVTDNEEFARKARSLRNWGKLVRKPSFPGDHITEYTNLVDGILYDEAYTYETIGFNMQATDIQAAYLREQLKRLPDFIEKRRQNFTYLWNNINHPHIQLSTIDDDNDPSYFGFSMAVENQRDQFAKYLEDHGIRTRPFFAGNVTRHPAYYHLYQKLPAADYLMQHAMFVGVWPGLTINHMQYIVYTVNNWTPTIS